MFSSNTYTVRLATEDDAPALRRLSALASRSPLTPPVLIGEVDGAPAAALALADGGLAALRPAAARRDTDRLTTRPRPRRPTMTRTPSDRDRLRLAFAELNRHGILARTALAATAEQGHALLRAELAAREPHGPTPYVFFTQADAQRFYPTGELIAALPLHCSSEEVATAVEAVLRGAGVGPQPADRTAVLHVAPATPRRASAPASRAAAFHRAAPSPWRWLGPHRPLTGS